MIEIKITKQDEGRKLKKLCFKYFDKAPQSFTYKMLRKKNIVLNDKRATGEETLCTGDSVKFYVSDETLEKLHTSMTPLDKKADHSGNKKDGHLEMQSFRKMIIGETEDYLILNKPAGVLSQKAEKDDYSINEAVIDYLIQEGKVTPESLQTFRPSVCNRLDRNTSGIIMAGKTLKGLQYLSEKVSGAEKADKTYLAIVHGRFDRNGIAELKYIKDREQNIVSVSGLDKDLPDDGAPSRGAVHDIIKTGFRFISYNSQWDISLVEAVLYTGKSHQIRASLKYLGFPICGDVKYGSKEKDRLLKPRPKRQLLHAYRLTLSDSETFTAELPADMKKYFEAFQS